MHDPGVLRVGTVPYLVGRPLDSGLGEEEGVELVEAVPARLVDGLREGSLDVALVSSIELFRREGYAYLPGMAVSGRGAVASVQLFLRRPVEELATVALDPSSRTAATLVRVLLAERADGGPEFVEVPVGEDPRAAGCDGWLRIGDEALREVAAADAPPVFNPSQQWCARTGLPFVFAAWIVRPGVDATPWLAAFERARARGTAAIAELAAQAADAWNLSLPFCLHYLAEECVYEALPDMHAALVAFRDAAAPLGLCTADSDPAVVGGFHPPAGDFAPAPCHRD
ncbi:MAG: menaquinone biosynthesis protein [Planctomycetota bacterium]|jgi:chorismate dehydratase|nr:menaquinone biosynthesis protein [Planctomycetota bacterium]MDP6763292.1 menaquinone biosynthesis protein [Planctomycetota bacterium]MDP6987970.1 menaquinone biosynthesis protein [Planctomycetota bacterium]